MDLISVTRDDATKFQIGVRSHQVGCDMSVGDGGQDLAPSPVELLAGSLGACIAMIVQSYCSRHGYEGDVEVSMTVELADKPKRVERIVVDVEVPDTVPEDKKEVIKRVAERCPIHETLKSPPGIDIDVV